MPSTLQTLQFSEPAACEPRSAYCAELLHARTAEGLVARLHVNVLWRYRPEALRALYLAFPPEGDLEVLTPTRTPTRTPTPTPTPTPTLSLTSRCCVWRSPPSNPNPNPSPSPNPNPNLEVLRVEEPTLGAITAVLPARRLIAREATSHIEP